MAIRSVSQAHSAGEELFTTYGARQETGEGTRWKVGKGKIRDAQGPTCCSTELMAGFYRIL